MALYRALIGTIVAYTQRAPWVVLIAAIALTAVSAVYSVRNLAIDTDTAAMISEDLPFRQRFKAFRAAFPDLADNVVIVIDADLPDRADWAVGVLAKALRAEPDRFPLVFSPDTDPFFLQNGLLYLDREDLIRLSDDLADAQGLLTKLAATPDLRGLADVLGDALTPKRLEDDQAAQIGRAHV